MKNEKILKLDYRKFNDNRIKKIVSRFGNVSNIKILYLSCYKPNYTRTETLLAILKRNNIEYKTILTGNSKLKYFKLLFKQLKYQRKSDLIIVGFRGHEILPLVKFFSNKPIIFDAFISVYDTLCFDRKIFKPNSIIGKFFKKYDKFLCKISDTILVDTKTHKQYFEKEFSVNNIDYLYLECNEKLFKPFKIRKKNNKFVIFWYGSANPLQGVNIILKAAKILERDKRILFKIVGPIEKKYSKLVEKLNLKNTEFIKYIPYEKLPMEIAKSDLCLGGHFSNIDKAKRVIPGKVYQFLSCGKKVLLGDNLANREIFKEGSQIKFVEVNSSEKLASEILKLIN